MGDISVLSQKIAKSYYSSSMKCVDWGIWFGRMLCHQLRLWLFRNCCMIV